MNFSPELVAFQGLLLSANNTYKFSSMSSRGGNESKILETVTKLYGFVQEKQYLTEAGVAESTKSEMRKLSFYLFLNAEIPVLEDLVEMPGIDMVIWTVPTIPFSLLCEIIWGLCMEKFLYEVISFCNQTFALQIITAFIDSIKHSTPLLCLDRIRILCAACYRLICRLHFFDYDTSCLETYLSDAYEKLLLCLTYFVDPPRLSSIANNEGQLYKYKGKNLQTIMRLILECLDHYTSTDDLECEGFDNIYLCTIKPEKIKTYTVQHRMCDSSHMAILDCLEKCNQAMMDKCMTLVMEINVEIFCAWSEILENTKSLQNNVGETCYLLKSKLEKVTSLNEHPVISMLAEISIKPTDFNDIIKQSDLDTLIFNINTESENRHLWIESAINRKDLCSNMGLLECLIANIEALKPDLACKLASTTLDYLLHEEDESGEVALLGVKSIVQCESQDAEKILDKHFNNKTFNNSLETNEFEDMETELFNKLISSSDANISEVISVFIQNPRLTYEKAVDIAVGNSQQCNIILKLLKIVDRFSCHYYLTDTEPCIMKVLEQFSIFQLETDALQMNFVNFVTELKSSGMLSGAKLLILIVMPNLHHALTYNNVNAIGVQVNILNSAYSLEELIEYRSPLLAMLSQILEFVRWNIKTYSSVAPAVLEQSLQFQIKLLNTYENGIIPENDSKWLKTKLKKLRPMNMYYYRQLWNPPGETILEVISGEVGMSMGKIVLLLVKILSCATYREWSDIWNSLVLSDKNALEMFHNALVIMVETERKNRTPNTWACILYCYRNFMMLFKDKYLAGPHSTSPVGPAIEVIVASVNMFGDGEFDEVSPGLLSLLSFILEKNSDYPFDVASIVSRFKHSKFGAMVNQIFSHE